MCVTSEQLKETEFADDPVLTNLLREVQLGYHEVSRRLRFQGSWTFISLNSRPRVIKKKKKKVFHPLGR